jgi:hypothetical protein
MYLPCSSFLEDLQEEITENMRAILIDWLIDVHKKFKLRDNTLYIAINIIDRYLSRKKIAQEESSVVRRHFYADCKQVGRYLSPKNK